LYYLLVFQELLPCKETYAVESAFPPPLEGKILARQAPDLFSPLRPRADSLCLPVKRRFSTRGAHASLLSCYAAPDEPISPPVILLFVDPSLLFAYSEKGFDVKLPDFPFRARLVG